MDFNGMVDKARGLLSQNKQYIDKGADAIDKATKGKYHDTVEKGRDAANKYVGGDEKTGPSTPEQSPGTPAPEQPKAAEQTPPQPKGEGEPPTS